MHVFERHIVKKAICWSEIVLPITIETTNFRGDFNRAIEFVSTYQSHMKLKMAHFSQMKSWILWRNDGSGTNYVYRCIKQVIWYKKALNRFFMFNVQAQLWST